MLIIAWMKGQRNSAKCSVLIIGRLRVHFNTNKIKNNKSLFSQGLHLDLIQYVTNYDWECTDCKMCMKCKVNNNFIIIFSVLFML
jgi:hypothetical protein